MTDEFGQSDSRPDEILSNPDCAQVPLGIPTDLHMAGMNAALHRWPSVETQSVPMLGKAPFVPAWKPHWQKVKVFRLTFPDGMEFLPPKKEDDDDKPKLKTLKPPKAKGDASKKKPTRLKAPKMLCRWKTDFSMSCNHRCKLGCRVKN